MVGNQSKLIIVIVLWFVYQMITKWLPNDYQMVTKRLPKDCQMITKRLSNDYQKIVKWLPNDCQMITKSLSNDYQMITKWLSNDYLQQWKFSSIHFYFHDVFTTYLLYALNNVFFPLIKRGKTIIRRVLWCAVYMRLHENAGRLPVRRQFFMRL